MPRVSTKTRNRAGRTKSCGRCGAVIEPGQRYHEFSFRYGGTHYRCAAHYPRQSELTQSKMSAVYAAVENAGDTLDHITDDDDIETIKSAVEEVKDAASEVADEYREAAEAMGGAGYENEERADELQTWADELDSWDPDEPDAEDFDEDAVRTEAEKAYAYGELPPHAQEAYLGPEDLPDDAAERQALMVEWDMDIGDRFETFVTEYIEERRPDDDGLENVVQEARDLIDGCPL